MLSKPGSWSGLTTDLCKFLPVRWFVPFRSKPGDPLLPVHEVGIQVHVWKCAVITCTMSCEWEHLETVKILLIFLSVT